MKNDHYISQLLKILDLDEELGKVNTALRAKTTEINNVNHELREMDQKIQMMGKPIKYSEPVLRYQDFIGPSYHLIGIVLASIKLGIISFIGLGLLSIIVPLINSMTSRLTTAATLWIFGDKATDILALFTFLLLNMMMWLVIVNSKWLLTYLYKYYLNKVRDKKVSLQVYELNKSEYLNKLMKDEERVQKELVFKDKLNRDKVVLLRRIESLKTEESLLESSKQTLMQKISSIYDALNILSKYRNFNAVCSFIENFQIERCYEFTGPSGAYSLYEQEIQNKKLEELMEKSLKVSSEIKQQNDLNTRMAFQMQAQNEVDRMMALSKELDAPYVEDESAQLLREINERLDKSGFKR